MLNLNNNFSLLSEKFTPKSGSFENIWIRTVIVIHKFSLAKLIKLKLVLSFSRAKKTQYSVLFPFLNKLTFESFILNVFALQSFDVLNGLLTWNSQKLFVNYCLKSSCHSISSFPMAKYVLERSIHVLIALYLKNLRILRENFVDKFC